MKICNLIALLLFSPKIFAVDTAKLMEVVRVRLDKDQASMKITGNDFFVIADGFQSESLRGISLKRVQKNQSWIWELTELDAKKQKHQIAAKLIQIMGNDLHKDGSFMPPLISLHGMKAKFDIVGELPLENYLIGVLASEMPLSWPEEALKAQAVAARSYTIAVAAERKKLHFDVESTIQDQVFRHVSPHLDEDPQILKAKKAVQATQGLVIYDSAGNVLKAYYHSDCGGKTKTPKSVWGYGINTGTAVDNSCPNNPKAKWVHKISNLDLSKKLDATKGLLEKLEVVQEARTGLQKVRLFWQSKQITEILGNSFRELLGYADLRSLNFKAEKKNEDDGKSEFIFRGVGFGHGVGMCQWGSRVMAQQGRYFDSILQHYYPLAAIGKKPNPLPGLKLSTSEDSEGKEGNTAKYQ